MAQVVPHIGVRFLPRHILGAQCAIWLGDAGRLRAHAPRPECSCTMDDKILVEEDEPDVIDMVKDALGFR